jgi:hypothetical protein
MKGARVGSPFAQESEALERRIFTLINEPRGDLYRNILETAAKEAETAYVVVRLSVGSGSSAGAALDRLEPHDIGRREVTKWPGTELMFGGKATLIQFRMSSDLASLLATIADGLYDWDEPNLPEDLGFLRNDGSSWLATIAHEHGAYLECRLSKYGNC